MEGIAGEEDLTVETIDDRANTFNLQSCSVAEGSILVVKLVVQPE